MIQSTMTVLEQHKSGLIAIVWNGVFASLQFNCSCLDAMHLCHGMCCTRRAGYSVELEESEKGRYFSVPHPTRPDVEILASTIDGSRCVYQKEDGLCSIHLDRPKMCRQWHCSPGGEMTDKQIERRDAGWQLLPVRKEESDFVLSRRLL